MVGCVRIIIIIIIARMQDRGLSSMTSDDEGLGRGEGSPDLVEGGPREDGHLIQERRKQQEGCQPSAADGKAFCCRLGRVANRVLHASSTSELL